ncbi:MAG: hypothetical protein ACYDBS_09515, partial [Acidimicrobiales bacterium]
MTEPTEPVPEEDDKATAPEFPQSVDDFIGMLLPEAVLAGADGPPTHITAITEELIGRLRQFAQERHRESLSQAIEFPNQWGAFPPASWFIRSVPPIVVDANTLRNDVIYAARNNCRTILINGANAGLFRLFCAQHVSDEMIEHGEEWAQAAGIEPDEYFERWYRD